MWQYLHPSNVCSEYIFCDPLVQFIWFWILLSFQGTALMAPIPTHAFVMRAGRVLTVTPWWTLALLILVITMVIAVEEENLGLVETCLLDTSNATAKRTTQVKETLSHPCTSIFVYYQPPIPILSLSHSWSLSRYLVWKQTWALHSRSL